MVRLKVEEGDRCVGSEVDLEVKLGMIEEKARRERVHALPAEEDEIMATVHGDVDGGVGAIGLYLASPADGSVVVDDLELKLGRAIDIQAIDRHLARIGHGSRL